MYSSPLLANEPDIVHGFSEVEEGNMDFRFANKETVTNARETFFTKVGLDIKRSVAQSGLAANIHVVAPQDFGRGLTTAASPVAANAVITNLPSVGLFLTIADCVPLILYDPHRHVIALVHAARNSVNLRLPATVIQTLATKYHSRPADLLAALGPAVRASSYVYDRRIYNLVNDQFRPFLYERAPDQIEVDNVGYIITQLKEQGLTTDHIDDSKIDTGTNSRYFSHVQSVRTHTKEGRLAALVALK